jgi:hypothetical protein
MAAHIINQNAITLIVQNRNYRVEKSDSRYATIIKNLGGSDEELLNILENRKVKDDAVKAGFIITDSSVTYKGEKLPDVLARKIRSIYNEGLPLALFEKFWENLNQNPDNTVLEQLYDFLSYRELPITEDGCFLAYKGVQSNYYSVMGNTETIVESGSVDSGGHILNSIGAKIKIKRNRMTTNRSVSCDALSCHCGSLDYARGWGSRMVIVKVNPKDVVSVPTDCNCQKLRMCEYQVVEDFAEEIVAPVLDDQNIPIESKDHIERKALTKERVEKITRIDNYLLNKQKEGFEIVTIRQIQNIFSPNWISKQEVMDILQELEYSWNGEDVQISGFDEYQEEDDWYDDGYDYEED